LLAPNGNPWPVTSGYVQGYSRRAASGHSTVTVDNSRNNSDVFVKLYALDVAKPTGVRVFFILAHDQFTVRNVTAGNYDVRYQDLDSGARAKSEPFELEETTTSEGVRFSRLTMTLYKVAHGNMRTYPIGENEFE
jgi:hypothetical protein